MKAIILAAGLGTRLEPITGGLPKCMVSVAGRPLVDRMLERIEQAGIRKAIVVTGHRADELVRHVKSLPSELAQSAAFVHNERYSDWGNFYSLLCAEEATGGDSFVKLDADVVMDETLLPLLLAAEGPGVLAVDRRGPLADEEMKVRVDAATGKLLELSKRVDPASAFGESLGVDRIDAELSPAVFAELRALIDDGETHEYYERAYERLIQNGAPFRCADVSSCQWYEIDNADDLRAAEQLLSVAS